MGVEKLSLLERFSLRVEDILITRLVPWDKPGPVFRWLFKIPIFFYWLNLPLFSGFILLLTTTGRKSGKKRHTPLEYRREMNTGYAIITAGWGGNTNWRRNILADPHVQVQIGRRKFDAQAEPLSDPEVTAWLEEAIRTNPNSTRIWSRWAGEPVTLEEPASLQRAARYFPCFRLKPIEQAQTENQYGVI